MMRLKKTTYLGITLAVFACLILLISTFVAYGKISKSDETNFNLNINRDTVRYTVTLRIAGDENVIQVPKNWDTNDNGNTYFKEYRAGTKLSKIAESWNGSNITKPDRDFKSLVPEDYHNITDEALTGNITLITKWDAKSYLLANPNDADKGPGIFDKYAAHQAYDNKEKKYVEQYDKQIVAVEFVCAHEENNKLIIPTAPVKGNLEGQYDDFIDVSNSQNKEIIAYRVHYKDKYKLVVYSSGHINANEASCAYMFYNFNKCENIDLKYFNLNNNALLPAAKTCKAMFYSCTNIKDFDSTINYDNFNVNNVEDLSYMFAYCTSATNINITKFNTQSLKYLNHMFLDCKNIKSLTFGEKFDTSNVCCQQYKDLQDTAFACVFKNCENLESIYYQKDYNWFDNNKLDNNQKFHYANSDFIFENCILARPNEKGLQQATTLSNGYFKKLP